MVLPEEPPLDWLPDEPLELPELPVPPAPDWLPDEPVPLWLVALLPPELPMPPLPASAGTLALSPSLILGPGPGGFRL